MSEIKLLPCPFCGGEGQLEEIHDDPEWHPTFYDPDSGGNAPVYIVSCKKCETSIKYKYKKEDAIKAWNTRKPMDDIVEQLTKEFKKYYGVNWHRVPCLIKAIDIVRSGGKE